MNLSRVVRHENEFEVEIDGLKVGTVWTTKQGFQCQLKFGVLKDSHLTLNGTGKTERHAIMAAIENGQKEADCLLRACEWLRGRI